MNRKNYLITGATSGIGKALVTSLLERGYNILGIGRDESKVEDLIEQYGLSFTFLSLDLSIDLDKDSAISEYIAKFGKLNGMVYCAGKEETLPMTLYSEEKLNNIFDINFFAPFQLLRTLSKKKASVDQSSFVFVSSVMGELGQPGKTGYCSSKAAILGLVRSAALELAPRQIRVNAISPGVVETPMTEKLFEQVGEEGRSSILKMHPLGFGKTEDIVPLIEFLLSDNSRWITGQNIKIDGGYSIQ